MGMRMSGAFDTQQLALRRNGRKAAKIAGLTCKMAPGIRQFGPGSLAKTAGQSEIAGGKFLDRAFTEREGPLVKAIDDAMKGGLQQ